MPDAVLAVLAFAGGAVFSAVANAATAEYRAWRDHRRAMETDRSGRNRQAATAILEEVDRLMADKYALGVALTDVPQSEIEPYYRTIRRRSVELADPTVRGLIEEIAEGFYYFLHGADRFGRSEFTLAHQLQHGARDILGAVLRGESVVEPAFFATDLRPLAIETRDMWAATYEAEEEYRASARQPQS